MSARQRRGASYIAVTIDSLIASRARGLLRPLAVARSEGQDGRWVVRDLRRLALEAPYRTAAFNDW